MIAPVSYRTAEDVLQIVKYKKNRIRANPQSQNQHPV